MGICHKSGARSERQLLKAAFYFCLPLFLSKISGALRGGELTEAGSGERISQQCWVGQGKDNGNNGACSLLLPSASCSGQTLIRGRGVKMSAWLACGVSLHRLLRAQPQSAQCCRDSERQAVSGWGGSEGSCLTPTPAPQPPPPNYYYSGTIPRDAPRPRLITMT